MNRLLYRLGIVAWVAGAWATEFASSVTAAELWNQNGCSECHRFSPDTPAEKRKGPDLFFAGNKFQPDWLEAWLQKPAMIREAGYVTDPGFLKGEPVIARPHPSLESGQAKAMAKALMQLTLPDWKSGVVSLEPLGKAERFKTKLLFERDYGCISCHKSVNLVGEPRGGVSGPSLLDAGHRYQVDWVYHWLKTPGRFEPKGRMPMFELNDEEARALARYVVGHKQETK